MVSFPTPESILQNCAIGSDNDTGGYSTANLEHVTEDSVPCLRFSGHLSLHVSADARKRGMTHSGWAGWRTRPQGANLFNRYYIPQRIIIPGIQYGILHCSDFCRYVSKVMIDGIMSMSRRTVWILSSCGSIDCF